MKANAVLLEPSFSAENNTSPLPSKSSSGEINIALANFRSECGRQTLACQTDRITRNAYLSDPAYEQESQLLQSTILQGTS